MKIKQISKKAFAVFGAAALITTAICAYKIESSKVTVFIKGNVKNVNYTGSLQSAIGYTVEISSPDYTTDDFVCYATDSVSGTNIGTYGMGICSSDFHNVNPNYSNVEFVIVEDGRLCINVDEDEE